MTARPPKRPGNIRLPARMACERCGGRTRIVRSEGRADGSVYRRHECCVCAERFTTYERRLAEAC